MTDVQSPPPALDALSTQYVTLAFGLAAHIDGAIDGYYGPEDLRPVPDAPTPSPDDLVDQANNLLAAIESADITPSRLDYLTAQARGMATMAAKLAGEPTPYEDEVRQYFDIEPERTPDTVYEEALAALDDALPGKGRGDSLTERNIAYRKQFEVPVEAAREIVPGIVTEVRRRTAAFVPLPEGESVELSFVSDKPWSGYNWYLGGNRSLIEINTDLPVKANALLDLMAHEGYPGHHTEHALKEQRLYRERGFGEHSILLINTPECVISEGIATLAASIIFAPGEAEQWQAEHILAPLGIAADPERDRHHQIAAAQRVFRSVSANAGIMLHQDGADPEDVIAYLQKYTLATETEARHRFRFVSDPLWGPYVFTYHAGRDLLDAWLDRPADENESTSADPWTRRQHRFVQLLEGQATPSMLRADLAP
ncbi:MAG: hypothetical protein QM589_15600 [Thermomicrobiales bacterium]